MASSQQQQRLQQRLQRRNTNASTSAKSTSSSTSTTSTLLRTAASTTVDWASWALSGGGGATRQPRQPPKRSSSDIFERATHSGAGHGDVDGARDEETGEEHFVDAFGRRFEMQGLSGGQEKKKKGKQ